ncbi:MAG: sulfatase [Planctomycetota bacterium]
MSSPVLGPAVRIVAAGLFLSFGAAVSAAERPNVLLLIADDLRPQLGCYGDPVVVTPRIDAFAEQALRFDRAYVQSAVCSPSRNSFLSGLRPNTTGLRGFGVHLRDRVPDVVTLPQHFKDHGYESRAFGKIFHIYVESMLGNEDDPASWSEPQWLPTVPVWGPEQNAIRERLIAEARASGDVFDHPHDWPRGGVWDDSDVPDEAMQDGETASAVAEYLASRDADRPFFLAVGFVRPHLPFNAPRAYWDLYRAEQISLPAFTRLPEGTPRWIVNAGMPERYYGVPPRAERGEAYRRRFLHAYLACISYVDACVGRVLDALEAAGHADDTVVVLVGDHGYQMGEYDSWGHKHANFEISTRAPLLVSSPGMTRPGDATPQLTEFLDLYPTLCELAGLPTPGHVEGASFAAVLDDPSASHRDAAGSEMDRRGRLGRSIRTDGFRYTEWRDRRSGTVTFRELYDHRNDESPGQLEIKNVAADPAFGDVVSRLSDRLARLIPADRD